MKHKKIIFITLAILFLAIGLFITFNISDENSECSKDSECVLQQVSCCPCSMGGIEKCIPKEKVSFYQEKLKNCPKDIVCPAVYNCRNISCECSNGNCTESKS